MHHEDKKNHLAIWVLSGIIVFLLLALNNVYSKNRQEGYAQKSTQPADDMASHHSGGVPKIASSATDLNKLVGKPSPQFSFADLQGNEYSNEKLKGKNVVLFFNEGTMCYPACWNQIVALAKDDRLKENGTVVLSVVADPPKAWQKAIQQMPELGIATVVFDKNAAVSKSFGMLTVPSSMHYGSLPGHSYVVIDKEGIVKHVYDDPSMAIHNDALANELARF